LPCRVAFDDLVDEAVLLGLRRREEAITLRVGLELVDGLARVLREDLVELRAHLHDLLGLDLDVRRLATRAAVRLVDHDAAVREGRRLPLLTGASSTAAIDAAWPMHTVATGQRTYCMVS
jgi:hypothetical protein